MSSERNAREPGGRTHGGPGNPGAEPREGGPPRPDEPTGQEEMIDEGAGDGWRGPKARHWADVGVLIASVWALVSGFRIPPDVMTQEGDVVAQSVPLLAGAYGLGGLLGLGGLAVAQKWPSPGRFIIGGGGLVILAGFFAMQEVTLVTLLSLGVPGLALILAAPFAGTMPRSVRQESPP
jgi:hypothetical protein